MNTFDVWNEMEKERKQCKENAPCSKWISVNERLPERPEYYPHCEIRKCYFLVALESGAVMSKYYDFDKNRWETPTYSPVSHWMPLPEPPEEGGGEDGSVSNGE